MVRRRHGSILQITCVAVLVAAVLGATAPRALADCYEPVDVSGAGTGWINGTYLHLGTASGKPAFGMPGIPLEWSGSRWEIGGSPEYANDADTLTPPSTGWYAVAGSNPAPRMSGGLECCTPISISGAPAASVAAGSPYSFTPTATGDCTPFTFNFGISQNGPISIRPPEGSGARRLAMMSASTTTSTSPSSIVTRTSTHSLSSRSRYSMSLRAIRRRQSRSPLRNRPLS